ncbi:hypothetical protein [Tannerella forsythia]|uniref:hypothetical protein n=1 Tax=Tannerella forsythia TaxID=28112 RepID=UPI003C761C3A
MKVEIESIVCNWAEEIPHILVRVINAISLSTNEKELRAAVKRIAEETELDKFFAYGYGSPLDNLRWVSQKWCAP